MSEYFTVKLLVVDDHEEFCEQLITAVEIINEEHPLECQVGNCGEEGYELAFSWRPHVLLLDIHTAGKEGYSLLRKLSHHLPVIAMSQSPCKEIESSAIKAGAMEYRTTPITYDDLELMLKEVIELAYHARTESGHIPRDLKPQ